MLLSSFYDITDRFKAEKALRESEERFSKAFRSSPAPMVISEIDTGFFLDVNDRFLWTVGYTREEIIGRTSFELGMFEDQKIRTEIGRQLAQNGHIYNEPVRLRINHGKSIEVLWSSEKVQSGGRDVMLTFLYDISERLKAEKALRTLNETLEARVQEKIEEVRKLDAMFLQQARLAAMGEMLTSISHHWRQPLNVIAVIIQNIRNKYLSGELTPEYMNQNVNRALDTAQEVSRTIDYFRKYLFPSAGSSRFLDVGECVRSAGRLMESMIGDSGTRLELDKIAEDGSLNVVLRENGNPEDLVQVFLHFFNNSLEAFRERKTAEPVIRISVRRGENDVRIRFSDNAGGIPTEVFPHLFEPYYSTKVKLKGTGLGLYVSRMIMENRFHGSIRVENASGGAEITVILPVKSDTVVPY